MDAAVSALARTEPPAAASAPAASPEAGGIEVRQATLADWPRIREFIADTYGTTAPFKMGGRWSWQFVDNPYIGEPDDRVPVWIAVADGRVLGQIALQEGGLWLKGRRVPASWIVDVMIRPEARGQRLGHRIHDALVEARGCLVTLTMAPATRRIAERAGCVTLGPTHQLWRPGRLTAATVRRVVAHKTAHKPRWRTLGRLFNAAPLAPALAAAGVRTIGALRGWRRAADDGFDLQPVERFPDALDRLFETVRPDLPAVFERSTRFLNWRFGKAPDLDYRKYVLWDGPTARGYLVLRRPRPEELPWGIVADLFAHPDDAKALDRLVEAAVSELAPVSEGIEAAASLAPYLQAFERAGFRRIRTMRPTVVCRAPELRAEVAGLTEGWHFSKADHDWDQVHPVP